MKKKKEWVSEGFSRGSNGYINIKMNEPGGFITIYPPECVDSVDPNPKAVQKIEGLASLVSSAPELKAALEVCYASLCTYGAHPIIQAQVEKALRKSNGDI